MLLWEINIRTFEGCKCIALRDLFNTRYKHAKYKEHLIEEIYNVRDICNTIHVVLNVMSIKKFTKSNKASNSLMLHLIDTPIEFRISS